MKRVMLNRVRQGQDVVAEVPLEHSEYRRWVTVRKPRSLDVRHPDYRPANCLYEIQVSQQPVSEDEFYFYDNEGYTILEIIGVDSEEELMDKLAVLVPNIDLFDYPWNAQKPRPGA